MSSLLPLLLASCALTAFPLAQAQPVDNAVQGIPSVSCAPESISISVNTERPFLGRIFVKGMSKRRECVREFLNNTYVTADLDIRLSACGMRRERKLSPAPGLEESITIVVSFHYVFITDVDRAYKIICNYAQDSLAVVTHGLNISMIPTLPLTPAPSGNQPDCQYEIRKGGFQGPMAMYAEVGDKLFHKWTCHGSPGMRILVKSCLVSDGTGEMFVVIDDRGCAVDPIVLSDLTYNGNSAYVKAPAFKFADTNFLGFSCTIQVCGNGEDCDNLSPPVCSVEGNYPGGILKSFRGRKNDAPLPLKTDEVDVSAPTLSILDAKLFMNDQEDKKEVGQTIHDDGYPEDLFNIVRERGNADGLSVKFPDVVYPIREPDSILTATEPTGQSICMSKFIFGILLVVTLGLMFVMGVVSVVLYTNLSKARKLWWNRNSPTTTQY